ncbi:unnamed protein product [Durusdinium trenchii]|uniref:Ubiquitin-like domain-containing protein n=1 Tax=Durusdinium trenchii TaxID=1381693 RepID=A0ABP0Q605_9DINO
MATWLESATAAVADSAAPHCPPARGCVADVPLIQIVRVRQMSGSTNSFEATPDMSVRALKRQLRFSHPTLDDFSKRLTTLELIRGDRKLENDKTLEELQIEKEEVLDAVFSIAPVQCAKKDESPCDLEDLRFVSIPSGVTEIEDNAFENCPFLISVLIPETVTEIGEAAFRDCICLERIEIPNTVTDIGEQAFANCLSMEKIEIPNSVTDPWVGDGRDPLLLPAIGLACGFGRTLQHPRSADVA